MMTIHSAVPADAPRLLEIYSYYVEKTAITFEYDVPSVEEFESRIRNTLKKYPYIVIEKDDRIIGYAYAGTFINRAAYDYSAEVSIYVDIDYHGHGAGRLLYESIESALKDMNITNLYACIGVPAEREDEYLTFNSMNFHKHMGYDPVGRFKKCGYKFNRWYDMVWMEKIIGQHISDPPSVQKYGQFIAAIDR